MTDSYTGIRTRENMVDPDEEGAVVVGPQRFLNLRARLMAANPVVEGIRTATPSAVERNLVPAEDLPAHERIAQLKQLVADMEHDWKTLNGFFNQTAQTRDWCSDYEGRLHNYNTYFKVLRMVGRPDNWYGSTSCWRSVDGDE